MTYCCEDRGFLFRRVGEVRECPFCEGPHFRTATAEEEKRLQALLNKKMETQKGKPT